VPQILLASSSRPSPSLSSIFKSVSYPIPCARRSSALPPDLFQAIEVRSERYRPYSNRVTRGEPLAFVTVRDSGDFSLTKVRPPCA
jgi:hypothetical protein